ncbi:MAG: alpha/beta hydrolase [Stenomitos rutilans HA7619-LM2]|jgi:pimeloyl-ACP methyl ester carboxylesterase|nr:alpha/beta hydrolase [Stenomitos rutilans HA7619-LM2]
MTTPDHSTPDITQFDISLIDEPHAFAKIPGYYINSTAAINIEDNPVATDSALVVAKIRAIADYLIASSEPQVIISIHGYGTQRSDAQKRYQKIHNHAATICSPQSSIFLGYLWPSEKPTGDPSINSSLKTKLGDAINALPVLLSGLIGGSFILSVITTILLFKTIGLNALLTPVLIVSLLTFAIVLALILLRLLTYFRDNYRATNYGVLDLVELIRQLDQAVSEKLDLTEPLSKDRRIKLSFIGHSMGCFIVTNTIRILSDVFDTSSIAQNPPSEIGRVFSLGRLVLVAPDIPAESIMPRRANFLRSSLRRCEEAYVFSNEGDLALRLASTAANYFSFPARKRSSGYRLGNVTAKHFQDEHDHTNQALGEDAYGIINLNNGKPEPPFKCLEVRASDREHQSLEELRDGKVQTEAIPGAQGDVIADVFTYFDCTDYVDFQDDLKESEAADQPRGVVSFALRKAALNLLDYALLNFSYFKQSLGFGGVNVHGGYFSGKWSQQMIYGLAFLGFREFLLSLPQESASDQKSPDAMKTRLADLATQCQQKGIQVVLAPIRYEKDILGKQPLPASSKQSPL